MIGEQLVLRCRRCSTRFTLVDVERHTDVNDPDQLLDVAIDFACPSCGGDFVVELAPTHRR